MTSNKTSKRAQARDAARWACRADELAAWTEVHLVNRRDIFGGQWVSKAGKVERTTWHDWLGQCRLIRHYAAAGTEDVIGLHAAAVDETSRWVAWDIDAHPGQKFDADANFALARRIQVGAWNAGVALRLIDSSGGRGGYHLWAPFAAPIAMGDARRLGLWLARHHAAFGFAKPPEVFPKSDHLTGKRCGNILRLPGRHHKRPSWSRVWSPKRGVWRTGDEAIDALLSLTGKPVDIASIVPADFDGGKRSITVTPRPERPRRAGDDVREVRLAREALKHYVNDDLDYDDWLLIGMALKNLDDEETAFELWDDWSAQSAKYAADVTAAKWESFQPSDSCGHVGLGTLFWRAKEAGWHGPAYGVRQDDFQARESLPTVPAVRERSSFLHGPAGLRASADDDL